MDLTKFEQHLSPPDDRYFEFAIVDHGINREPKNVLELTVLDPYLSQFVREILVPDLKTKGIRLQTVTENVPHHYEWNLTFSTMPTTLFKDFVKELNAWNGGGVYGTKKDAQLWTSYVNR